MPNTLISSEIGSERRTILGHPQMIECKGICVLSLAHGSELSGSDVICIERTKIVQKIFFKFSQEGLCLDFFSRDFSYF